MPMHTLKKYYSNEQYPLTFDNKSKNKNLINFFLSKDAKVDGKNDMKKNGQH